MTDPYQTLGISRTASDSEVKTKYRELSRKYHPDANVGNPNQKAYEEKFKEVQQAYSMIMDERQGKTVNNNYGFNGYDRNDSYESQDDKYMMSALNYIQNGYFREGLNVLNSVKNRKASWYYYSAYANYNLGNNMIALEHINTACRMEPNNPYYVAFRNEINGSGYRYQSRSENYGGSPITGNFASNPMRCICPALILLNCLCGGGLGYIGLPILCCI